MNVSCVLHILRLIQPTKARQYLPKTESMANFTQQQCDAIAWN